MKPRKNFRSRPKKRGSLRRIRVQSQKKRLIEAGYDQEVLDKMNVVEVRELLKQSKRKSTKTAHLTKKIESEAAKRDASGRKERGIKKRLGKKKPGRKKK